MPTWDDLLMTIPTFDTKLFSVSLNTLATDASTIGLRGDEQRIALRSHRTGRVLEFELVGAGRNGDEITHWHYRSTEKVNGADTRVVVYND
jgi:hypothetical protein